MKSWFSRNWHWLFFLLISVSFMAGLWNFTLEATAVVGLVFGGIGTVSVGILVYYIEKEKRQTGD
ncbi:hypothetical protein [Planococcus salinus]|uniref:Uncharacterized protein n=1 Tax=Planococcus salinus TaxID=1848460 RepID=A0A3M8P5E1_9BACL|nr:hypothetical protein [Planococcus salinus]RNF38906.1 hypothetical protein EEX84_12360 [Planococcus salinus]